jgi:hypothetical protein
VKDFAERSGRARFPYGSRCSPSIAWPTPTADSNKVTSLENLCFVSILQQTEDQHWIIISAKKGLANLPGLEELQIEKRF